MQQTISYIVVFEDKAVDCIVSARINTNRKEADQEII